MADTSIYANLLRPPKSVAEYDAEAQQAQANKLSLLLKQGEYDSQQRGLADEQRMNSFYQNSLNPDGTLDRAKLLTSVASGGLGSRIPGLQKQFLDMDKAEAEVGEKKADTTKKTVEADAKRFETAQAQLSAIYNAASGARDQASYTMALQGLQRAGIDTSTLPQQFDPAYVQNAQVQALTALQRLEQAMKEKQLAATIRGQDVAAATARRGQDISASTARRGQDMTDRRQSEGNEIQRQAARSQVIETPDGVQLIDKGTGEARPVTSGGKALPGKPSEAQRKELMSISQQKSIINGAKNAAEEAPTAFSFTRGAVGNIPYGGESIAGRFDSDKETQARAYVFNNVSKVINERAGAAQSAQELARLRSFLPADTDNAKQIQNKLEAFDKYLSDLESGVSGKSPPKRTVTRTGTVNGRKVNQYSDGSIEYAD